MIRKKIGIVIPARNEEESLTKILENITSSNPSIKMNVFVDDGSEDGTYKVARERGADAPTTKPA